MSSSHKQPIQPTLNPLSCSNIIGGHFYIFSYPGVYSMELSKMINGEYQRTTPNTTLDPFSLPGCYPYDRRLIYKHLVQQHVDQGEYFFTNMYIDENIVFVTRSDNALLIFEIVTNDQERIVTDLKLKDVHNTSGSSDDHTIVCLKSNCVIFAESMAFIYISKENSFTQINMTQFPIDVYLDEKTKALYLSYGKNTVDVYLFNDKGNLQQLTTITFSGKIVQTRTNQESTKLFLLDQENGLLVYNIISIEEYSDTGFIISLKNGEAFDFYQSTFFIVAKTNDDIPYALEIFLNDKEYYFNKIYSKDMEIFDVWVGEHFAVLIGSEVHRVIYHSVYNKLISESEAPLFFQDQDLVNVEEFTSPLWSQTIYTHGAIEQDPFSRASIHYKQSFMVGISSNDLSIFSIKNISPWLQCKPSNTNSQQYSLQMNSTTCSTKDHENDHSPFRQCHITHNFTLTGNQVLFYQEDKNLVIIVGCSLGAFILLLLIVVIGVKKYLQHKINSYAIDSNSPRPLEEVEFDTIPHENAIL